MIERKSRETISIPDLDRLSRRYHRLLQNKENEASALYERIARSKTMSNREKQVALRRGLTSLIEDMMRESETYFFRSMGTQYDADRGFLESYLLNRQEGGTKKDNRFWTGRQRRAASDKEKNYYIRYSYAPDVYNAKGELIERGRMMGKYEGKLPRDIVQEVTEGTIRKINANSEHARKIQAFRDAVGMSSDYSMNSNIAFWSKTMDEYQEQVAEGTPLMQHIAHSSACVFCKMFDINNYRVSSSSKRPHIGCKCMRVPMAHADLLIDTQPWREAFEDMEADFWKQAAEEGNVPSYKEMINGIRKKTREKKYH